MAKEKVTAISEAPKKVTLSALVTNIGRMVVLAKTRKDASEEYANLKKIIKASLLDSTVATKLLGSFTKDTAEHKLVTRLMKPATPHTFDAQKFAKKVADMSMPAILDKKKELEAELAIINDLIKAKSPVKVAKKAA